MLKDDFLRPLLTRGERKIWGSLTSPMKIQGFLDQAAYSCEKTYRCPLRGFRERQAHWFDGAIFDGLVETPSAALRGNPALLDKKPPFWDAGLKLPIFEGKRPFKKYLTG